MNKKGFMFIETIVVLVVVALSLTSLLASYSLITRKVESRKHYDLPSDLYFVYSISKLGATKTVNYQNVGTDFIVTRDNCQGSYMGQMVSNCNQLFKDTNLIYFGVINDVDYALSQGNTTEKYDNGTIEYFKTLKKCRDKNCTDKIGYVFGVFYRTGNYYYAATEIK